MKIYYIFIGSLVLSLFVSCTDLKEDESKNNEYEQILRPDSTVNGLVLDHDKLIQKIKFEFIKINHLVEDYEVVTQELNEESTEGGNLNYYYEENELKKVISYLYGETGKLVEEYYFSKGNLIFIFSRKYTYDKPIYMEESVQQGSIENRYYFNNRKLILWLNNKNEVEQEAYYLEKELEILDRIRAYNFMY